MLDRAADNGYSWLWASHIRTKQSKWLDNNLQDMEEKISSMLEIIENNGDTFLQRVELYFKKRPELVTHVQETYRSYRALAERYDHLSKDMQSANRTIAAVFPEQVEYTLEDDDELASNSSTASTPSIDPKKAPNLPKKVSKKVPILNKELPNRADPPYDGLTEDEAQEEIIKIQKEMLALQNEREFLETICRRCNEKSGGIELQITDMKAKVGKLGDKFGFINVIDDDISRSLKGFRPCQDSLGNLPEKQEESTKTIEAENRKSKDIMNKYTSLGGEVLPDRLSEKLQNVNEARKVHVKGSIQNDTDVMPENDHQEQQKEVENKDFAAVSINSEQKRRQEDNEKRLSEEFGSVVRNYVEVKQRISDVEKKNKDGFFELVLQIREVKNELAVKDQKIESLKTNKHRNHQMGFNCAGSSPESLIHTESLGEFWSNEKEEVDHEMTRNTVSTVEHKLRTEIDQLLEGNLEFWMRFSHSINQVDKFTSSVKELKAELVKLKASTLEDECQSMASQTRAIYKNLSEVQTQLTLWLENNAALKDEIQSRDDSLFSIQEEIVKLSKPSSNNEEPGLHRYQAARFLGEVLNRKQETEKVFQELQAGRISIVLLKEEIEKTLADIDQELAIARRSSVPLQLFLFGAKSKKNKSKKRSILSRIQAGFQNTGPK